MSKTYSNQVERAKLLVAGLRKNYGKASALGVNAGALDELEAHIARGERLNGEVERMREAISETVRQANGEMVSIKEQSLELKKIVKRHVDISHWPDFGILDKR